MLILTTGDLFENKHGAECLGHGTNCMGVMGAGIAPHFKSRWPKMFEEYATYCKNHGAELAGHCTFHNPEGPRIVNLYTQVNTGPDAKIEHVKAAFTEAVAKMDKLGLRYLAIPAIGCGIGGLDFVTVAKVAVEVFGPWEGRVYLYLPQ